MSPIERFLAFCGVDVARENLHLKAICVRLQSELDDALVKVCKLKSTRDRMEEEISVWRATARKLESERRELSGTIEEQNSRIAILLDQLQQMKLGATQIALPGVETGSTEPQAGDDLLVFDTVRDEVWRLVGIFFDERHWWHLQLGDLRIKVPIPDKSFLEQVAKRKVFFAAGDAMRLRMRTQTYRKSDGNLYAKFTPEEVLAVLPPDRQLNLQTVPPAPPPEQGVQL